MGIGIGIVIGIGVSIGIGIRNERRWPGLADRARKCCEKLCFFTVLARKPSFRVHDTSVVFTVYRACASGNLGEPAATPGLFNRFSSYLCQNPFMHTHVWGIQNPETLENLGFQGRRHEAAAWEI